MFRAAHLTLLTTVFSGLICGCVARPQTITPLTASNNGYRTDQIEQSLIALSNQAHQDFIRQGLLVNDPELNRYIDGITQRFVPALTLPAQPHYFVLKDASINAMAFPNGNVYINIGLIAKLESEDQLALVLAHETAHFVQRHSYKGQLDRQNSTVAAHVTDLLLFGTGLVYIPYALDLLSFSREQEKEADLFGLDYLMSADYNLDDASRIFTLLGETKHGESRSAWDNHPDLQSRLTYSRTKIAERSNASTRRAPRVAEYEAARRHVADLNIQTRLLNKQYELASDATAQEAARQGENSKWHSYRGDALRGRAEHPDAAARENAWLYKKKMNDELTFSFAAKKAENLRQANASYEEAIRLDSDFAPAYRGLGLVAIQQGSESAKQYLQHYLELNPSAADRRYIEGIIRKLAR